jgi:hypothetical protein
MFVAEREIFFAISRILWCFDLIELADEPINLIEYDGLSGRSPTPFRAQLKLRHDNVLDVANKMETGGLH